MRNLLLLLMLISAYIGCTHAQQPQNIKTANDYIKPYEGAFRYGSNMGYYPPYNDNQLADIAAQAGVNAMRPGFFEHFAETWGYDIRHDAFNHYDSLGIVENVCFIGYPSPAHRDNTIYCGKDSSALFANMYEPIWDNGENGTPVNEKNYYASFVYRTVKNYGKTVRFWEVWNEPDFATTFKTEMAPGLPGAWWNTNPDPCEYNLHAPVMHYIRLLRISYEVIKTIDPNAYVCVGGIGFSSFLDVLLRQTDNPVDGSVTPQYPLRGGAYFDVLSYHSYPHIDNSVRQWSDKINGFEYFRHSDKAVEGVYKRKGNFETVLLKYGYDGQKFPKKPFMITECNIPAKPVGEFMGSYEAQRNFIMKALVKAQEQNLLQFHIYSLGELTFENQMRNEFDMMGLYKKLEGEKIYNSPVTPTGIAYRTTSKILNGYTYDVDETAKLKLPQTVDGGAFKHPETKEVRYCLWAKTNKDQSEQAEATYTFPFEAKEAGDTMANVGMMRWDYTQIEDVEVIPATNVKLTATPMFFYESTVRERAFSAKEPIGFEEDTKKKEVTITYNTDKEAPITLKIYCVEDKNFIKIYENQPLPKGFHQRKLNTKDLKKGLYIIQLTVDKKPYTKKMFLGETEK